MADGGTGASTLSSGEVLIGNGTNAISTLSRSGIDSRTAFPPGSHNHDDIYYTETELNGGQLDNRYYTETETNTLLSNKAALVHTHSLSDITNLQRSYVSSDSTTSASFKQLGTFTLTQNKTYKIKISGMYTRSAGTGGSYGINLAVYSSITGVSALNGQFNSFRASTTITVGSISTTLATTTTSFQLSDVNTSTNGKLSFNLEGTVTTTGGTSSTFFIGFFVTGATGNTVGVENVVMQAELLN